jgi:hypothetical protein
LVVALHQVEQVVAEVEQQHLQRQLQAQQILAVVEAEEDIQALQVLLLEQEVLEVAE